MWKLNKNMSNIHIENLSIEDWLEEREHRKTPLSEIWPIFQRIVNMASHVATFFNIASLRFSKSTSICQVRSMIAIKKKS